MPTHLIFFIWPFYLVLPKVLLQVYCDLEGKWKKKKKKIQFFWGGGGKASPLCLNIPENKTNVN